MFCFLQTLLNWLLSPFCPSSKMPLDKVNLSWKESPNWTLPDLSKIKKLTCETFIINDKFNGGKLWDLNSSTEWLDQNDKNMFKDDIKTNMLMCLLCSKLTIKTPKHANVFVFKINYKDTNTCQCVYCVQN